MVVVCLGGGGGGGPSFSVLSTSVVCRSTRKTWGRKDTSGWLTKKNLVKRTLLHCGRNILGKLLIKILILFSIAVISQHKYIYIYWLHKRAKFSHCSHYLFIIKQVHRILLFIYVLFRLLELARRSNCSGDLTTHTDGRIIKLMHVCKTGICVVTINAQNVPRQVFLDSSFIITRCIFAKINGL